MNDRRSKTIFITVIVIILGAAAWLARDFAHKPEKIEQAVAADQAQAESPAQTPTDPTQASVNATATPSSVAPSAAASAEPALLGANAPLVSPAVEEQFQGLRRETFALIPSQAQLRKLDTEEAHFTPKEVIAASIKIGEIAQMIQDHPELANDGLRFYKDCAETQTSPNSVRASCLVNFEKLSKASGGSVSAPSVPEHVRQLADKITS